eukprot:3277539-Pleurochrysis_carterae.AAC.1
MQPERARQSSASSTVCALGQHLRRPRCISTDAACGLAAVLRMHGVLPCRALHAGALLATARGCLAH